MTVQECTSVRPVDVYHGKAPCHCNLSEPRHACLGLRNVQVLCSSRCRGLCCGGARVFARLPRRSVPLGPGPMHMGLSPAHTHLPSVATVTFLP